MERVRGGGGGESGRMRGGRLVSEMTMRSRSLGQSSKLWPTCSHSPRCARRCGQRRVSSFGTFLFELNMKQRSHCLTQQPSILSNINIGERLE